MLLVKDFINFLRENKHKGTVTFATDVFNDRVLALFDWPTGPGVHLPLMSMDLCFADVLDIYALLGALEKIPLTVRRIPVRDVVQFTIVRKRGKGASELYVGYIPDRTNTFVTNASKLEMRRFAVRKGIPGEVVGEVTIDKMHLFRNAVRNIHVTAGVRFFTQDGMLYMAGPALNYNQSSFFVIHAVGATDVSYGPIAVPRKAMPRATWRGKSTMFLCENSIGLAVHSKSGVFASSFTQRVSDAPHVREVLRTMMTVNPILVWEGSTQAFQGGRHIVIDRHGAVARYVPVHDGIYGGVGKTLVAAFDAPAIMLTGYIVNEYSFQKDRHVILEVYPVPGGNGKRCITVIRDGSTMLVNSDALWGVMDASSMNALFREYLPQ